MSPTAPWPRRSRRAVLAGVLGSTVGSAVLSACGAGRDPRPRTGTGTVGLGIVGVLTRDLDTSLAFYRRLGLDLPATVEGHSYRLRMPDGHVLFWEDASAVHAFDPSWEPPVPGDRAIALEFGFATVADLDATYAALVAAGAGAHRAPFDQSARIRYAIVTDPDGNQISLRHPASG